MSEKENEGFKAFTGGFNRETPLDAQRRATVGFRPINSIIVHHSATEDGRTVSWSAIEDYHTKVRGFSAIGYHAGVELVGDRYQAFFGRPFNLPGAHVRGRNADTIGVVLVGDFQRSVPSEQQFYVAARRVIVPLLLIFGLQPHDVHGHRDVALSPTECPGAKFDMEAFREIISGLYGGNEHA